MTTSQRNTVEQAAKILKNAAKAVTDAAAGNRFRDSVKNISIPEQAYSELAGKLTDIIYPRIYKYFGKTEKDLEKAFYQDLATKSGINSENLNKIISGATSVYINKVKQDPNTYVLKSLNTNFTRSEIVSVEFRPYEAPQWYKDAKKEVNNKMSEFKTLSFSDADNPQLAKSIRKSCYAAFFYLFKKFVGANVKELKNYTSYTRKISGTDIEVHRVPRQDWLTNRFKKYLLKHGHIGENSPISRE
jgi:hypothetical protein